MSDTTALVPAELEQAVATSGLAPESVRQLLAAYAPHFQAFNLAEAGAISCPLDDPKQARARRLELKNIRVASEKTRKEQKDESLRFGQACDRIARMLKERIEPLEVQLDQIERAKEIAEAVRVAALQAERQEAIAPYVAFVTPADITSLGTLTGMQFAGLYDRARTLYIEEQERIAAEEAARLALVQQERDERERIRQENERLRAERAEIERQAAQERRQRETAEAELRAKAQAEWEAGRAARAAEEERIAAERAAAAAPDREKLAAFAGTLRALHVPECGTEAGRDVAGWIASRLDTFARLIEEKAAAIAR